MSTSSLSIRTAPLPPILNFFATPRLSPYPPPRPPPPPPPLSPGPQLANARPANVFLPKDRISMSHQGFGFCEFLAEDDAEYAVKIMNQIKLYGKPIRVNKASYDKKQLDVGANLFIGSLDLAVDENALFDTFTTFGSIAEHPKVCPSFYPA